MTCKFCGETVEEDFLICPECGLSQDENGTVRDVYICPVCGAENLPGQRKCDFCCSLFPKE